MAIVKLGAICPQFQQVIFLRLPVRVLLEFNGEQVIVVVKPSVNNNVWEYLISARPGIDAPGYFLRFIAHSIVIDIDFVLPEVRAKIPRDDLGNGALVGVIGEASKIVRISE